MTLTTKRLILRPWDEADAEALYEYAKDPAVGPVTGWPVHTDVENSRQVIKEVLSTPETYAVVLKETGRPVGSVGLMVGAASNIGLPDTEGEIGYWIGVPFWGKGLIPEAVEEVIRHAFEDLDLEVLWCGCFEGNEKSRRVQEKCGFTYHHTEKDIYWRPMDDIRTEHITRLTKEEWMKRLDYTDINAKTIDRWVGEGWQWGKPVSHEEYLDALSGRWKMLLTPLRPVPADWFPELRGKKVLGLAAGGAQQMPVFAALGAECTVLDYSERQIESERLVAEREGYQIHAVCADMTRTFPFEDGSFDLIFHPVSNCYIRDVDHVWKECARVIRPGGLLMAGLDNGFNYLFGGEDESRITGRLPFDPLADPEQMEILRKDDAGVQFSHSIGEQIGGQIRAGFELLDVYEDTNDSGFLKDRGVPTFWATLSKKK